MTKRSRLSSANYILLVSKMDTKESIRQEKIAGTYDRNKLIRLRCEYGVSQAAVGRLQDPPISRQRVFQILHQQDKPGWIDRLKMFFGG